MKTSSVLAVALLIFVVSIAGCVGQSGSQTVSAGEYATVQEALDSGKSLKCEEEKTVTFAGEEVHAKGVIYISNGKVRSESYVDDRALLNVIYADGKIHMWVKSDDVKTRIATTERCPSEPFSKECTEYYENYDTVFHVSLLKQDISESTCVQQAVPDSLFVPPSE